MKDDEEETAVSTSISRHGLEREIHKTNIMLSPLGWILIKFLYLSIINSIEKKEIYGRRVE